MTKEALITISIPPGMIHGCGRPLVSVVAGLAGLVIGYLIRLNEFRRDRRLVAYSEFVGAFLAAAHAGAALFSVGVQQGERFFADENRAENSELWQTFGAAAQEFETATARLRLVGSDAVRQDSMLTFQGSGRQS
jgi:hypothetical protein